MQMNLLANHPAYFGLWGVQPCRSNYVDEEILGCMGLLLRHYCIEGKAEQIAPSLKVEGADVQPGAFCDLFRSARGPQPFSMESPFCMTYYWLQFRAKGSTATLVISDWADTQPPGGPIGQEVMVSFVEVQPVLEPPR